jgi:ribosomal protein S18 acetylase RimI-like enzyme
VTDGVRPADTADAEPMAQVFVRAWRQAYPGVVPDAVLTALDQDEIASWLATLIESRAEGQTDVAIQDGRVTGFVRYGPPGHGATTGYVFGLYVDPDAAGRGTGSALLRHAEERLAERGCAAVALHVFEANQRARALYARAGYRPDGTSRVEPQYQANELRLVKALP